MQVILIFGLIAVCIGVGIPVAFALGLASLAFLVIVTNVPLMVVVQRLYMGVDNFTLLAVPLFIFVGVLMNKTRLSRLLVDHAMSIVGHMRGGLSAVNIVTSMFFAGISGTSMADTAAVGGVLIPAMLKKGYDAPFTGAVTASSSTIGIIIPPSVPMILYAVYVGMSVTTLFIAGIIPGILIGVALLLVSYIISRKRNYVSEEAFSWGRLGITFVHALPAIILPAIILGGIMGGVFTATEAAAVASLYVALLGIVYGDLKWKEIHEAAKETALLTGQVMLIIAVASLLGWVFAYARIPQMLVAPVLNITRNPILYMWIVTLVLIVAGTFLHGTAMLVVVIPLFLPVTAALGIHQLQFAMLVIMCWGIGQQTPPVGSALYITCTIAQIDMWTLTKANIPFILSMLAILALIIHLPEITVFPIPRLLGLM